MIKFGDLVEVKTGFYEGCKGFAIGIEKHPMDKSINFIQIEIAKIFKGIEVREKTIIEPENNLIKEVIKWYSK